MALACGVDLVLELPVVYACHNARLFASAAVDILVATGVVREMSFGMETPDLATLERLADVLNDEPEDFRALLKMHLAEGYSFVQARSMALDSLIPGALDFLRGSNNNLALAYVKRIREKKYSLAPFAVERVGAGYHDREMICGEIASATAIRAALTKGNLDAAAEGMPTEAAKQLLEAREAGHVVDESDRYWRVVKQAFIRASEVELSGIAEMREGLENRMAELAWRCDSFEEFVDACTSRRYTKGRIQRYCAHLLLRLNHETSRDFQENGPAYIRVLGANERGRELLGAMRKTATLPVVSGASAPFSPYANRMMQFEHVATELWELLTKKPRPRNEARFVPAMMS